MAALICELCGSNDIVKQDGLFVCQHCGTKYSLEEAKKLLGTVKIDKSEELSNALELARRAKSENNSKDAVKYYSQILAAEPNNWEAYFYTRYYSARDTTIGNIGNSATTLANSIENTLKLVKELPESGYEQEMACLDIFTGIQNLSGFYVSNLSAQKSNYSDQEAFLRFVKEHMRGINYLNIVFGDGVLSGFDNKDLAVMAYKSVLNAGADFDGLTNEERKSVEDKVIALDPSYTPPAPKPSTSSAKTGGCYVATAVYGSYDCPEVWTLRRYRDYTLAGTWYGRAFIKAYYTISPTLVKWFGETPWFRNMWKPKLDRMVERLNKEGIASTPYQDRHW